ncbi:hypothetical protein PISMIDRAFT_685101 [Pisolithus microcarpus 441]|uniref:Uncharacterized protein n=1 Tax=Pisolithus microcarpus 441 TaxID=765257 RepID=A0A0C9Z5D4_9AGAM|nr:hypothetical protein PISMIDRAFT_685101 [Pisolithus microcarpus 441]
MTLARTYLPVAGPSSTFLMTSSSNQCLTTKRGLAAITALSRASSKFSPHSPLVFSDLMRAAYVSSHVTHSSVALPVSKRSGSGVPSSNPATNPSSVVAPLSAFPRSMCGRKNARFLNVPWKSSLWFSIISKRGWKIVC